MPRRAFPNAIKRQAYARSKGICECFRLKNIPGLVKGGCGRKLGIGNTFYEHVDPDALGGEPSLDNCAVLTKTCWQIKTRRFDLPTIAKDKRLRDMGRGIVTGRSVFTKPIDGSRLSPFKKKLDGTTERRIAR